MSQTLKTGTRVTVLRPRAIAGQTGEVRFYMARLSDEQGTAYYEIQLPSGNKQLPVTALQVLK